MEDNQENFKISLGIMAIFRYSHEYKVASSNIRSDKLSHCNKDSNQGTKRIIFRHRFSDFIILR